MHVGNPSTAAAYQILASAVKELARTGIITSCADPDPDLPPLPGKETALMDARELEIFRSALHPDHPSVRLYGVAERCGGMSGRTLRKLPFLAHAFFVRDEETSLEGYLGALEKAVEREVAARKTMKEAQ